MHSVAAWPNWIRHPTTDREILGSSPRVVIFFFLSVACTPVGGKPWAPSLGRPCEGSTASIVNTPLPVVVRFVLEYWSNIYIVDCFVEQRRAPNGAAISR